MMLALNRQLLPSYQSQLGDRSWPYQERRDKSRLLSRQTVVVLGFGAIGRRLSALLAPFGVRIYAVRRQIHSEPGVRVVSEESLTKVLSEADHVVNVLPENPTTLNYVNARRISCFKAGARFYNVGRGPTVDQDALIEGLKSGRIGAAYLDVMVPEPLPPGHPLWTAPNCFITPHTAGGRNDINLELCPALPGEPRRVREGRGDGRPDPVTFRSLGRPTFRSLLNSARLAGIIVSVRGSNSTPLRASTTPILGGIP